MLIRLFAFGVVAALLGLPRPMPAGDAVPAWANDRDERVAESRAGHLGQLGVPAWHRAGYRGQAIKVAVLDSGFRGYRDQVGKSLPTGLVARSARRDGNMEARNSQHGVLCGEVVHAIAPGAQLLFANWDPDNPDSFLAAVRWARDQGAKVITCSVIMPAWSDGEGNGPVHAKLREILGDGSQAGDPLFFSCAGNVARRHWAGTFRPAPEGCHVWSENIVANPIYPWGDERVTLDLCWSDSQARYRAELVDAATGQPVPGCECEAPDGRSCAVVRFTPQAGRSYAVRVRQEKGTPGTFHFTSLGADLGESRTAGSIPFPGDGPEVVTVGAVNRDGQRAASSACGPNSPRPKPDVVAPVPFATHLREQPFSGTSCASPQAAAVAALCWSANPTWTADRVRTFVTSKARDLGPVGHDCETGYGSVCLPAPAPRSSARLPVRKPAM